MLLQYMAGGDLGSAISRDIAENGMGPQRRLGWYARGRVVLLCVARGLAYLHSERVRCRRVSGLGAEERGSLLAICAFVQELWFTACFQHLKQVLQAAWHCVRAQHCTSSETVPSCIASTRLRIRSPAACHVFSVAVQASRSLYRAAAGALRPEVAQHPAEGQQLPRGEDR